MSKLINGKWVKEDVRLGEKNSNGEFVRAPTTFRHTIEKKGAFQPAKERYHLYVSYACPWAHRTLIMRTLKNLEDLISVDVVSPLMLDEGWSFKKDVDNFTKDNINGFSFLKEVYLKADPKFTGRVTVPILWDKETQTIVNNESSEIIRIFNTAFNDITKNQNNYYPLEHKKEIDNWNKKIYESINNGVYRCGFARSQKSYESAFDSLYESLFEIEKHLKHSRFLVGDNLTEADIRLFPTLIRFDPVYHTHFKCNGKLIRELPNLSRFIEEFKNLPGVSDTINMKHIKLHYYYSHDTINPSRIVPKGL